MAEAPKPQATTTESKQNTLAKAETNAADKEGSPIQLPSRQAAAQQPNAKAEPGKEESSANAVSILTQDHRRVEKLFADYEKASGRTAKKRLADQICGELEAHTQLEEQIFYPACREAVGDDDMLDEAQVEHDTAKLLVAELRRGQPGHAFFDAKVKVLAEYIKHHVGEEEGPKGIFAQAKSGNVNLQELGQQIAAQKQQILQKQTPDNPQFISIDPMAASKMGGRKSEEEESTMARLDYASRNDDRSRNRGRDEEGRFTSERSRSTRGRDDDDQYRRGGRARDDDEYDRRGDDDDRAGSGRGGWFGDSEGHSEASRRGWDDRGSSRSRYDDDERDNRSRSSRGRDDDNDFDEAARRRSRDDDDDDRGRGRRGWFGDPEGHSQAARRGADDRGSSRSQEDDDDRAPSRYRSSRNRDDDDDRRGSRGSDRDEGRGGWFGDTRGHSEAARRGWEDRGSSRSSSTRDDDRGGNRSRSSRDRGDDYDRQSSSRSSSRDDDDDRGRGGWFGDSRGHAEAARRGWEDRR